MIILSDCLSDEADEGCMLVAENLIRHLKKRNPNTMVITYRRKSSLSDLHLKLNPLFLNNRLLRLLRRKQEPVLYIPFSSNTAAGVLRTFLLAKLSKSELTVLYTLRWNMDWMSRILLKYSGARVAALSAASYAFYRSVTGERALYLKTGVDTCRFTPVDGDEKARLREKYRVCPGKKVLLHVGHLKEGRNVRQLLKVGMDYHVFLVTSPWTGNEQSAKLRRLLESRPNTTVIDSYIPDIQQLYQMTDVYFFPVLEAGNCIDVPLSVLEAAACNIPVVATRYGELRDFSGKEGFYFLDSFESEGLNRTLARAVSTPCDTRGTVLPYDWSNAAEALDRY